MRHGPLHTAVLATAFAAASLSAQQLPGVDAFQSGSYEAEPRIVASGNIQSPPFLDAWVNNRGAGYDGVVSLQINTPGGTFAASKISARMCAEKCDSCDGFNTIVQPVASAGNTLTVT